MLREVESGGGVIQDH
jgi:hypothetical protein